MTRPCEECDGAGKVKGPSGKLHKCSACGCTGIQEPKHDHGWMPWARMADDHGFSIRERRCGVKSCTCMNGCCYMMGAKNPVAEKYLAALEWCARALQEIASHKGLVADHGDALDNALKLLRPSRKES